MQQFSHKHHQAIGEYNTEQTELKVEKYMPRIMLSKNKLTVICYTVKV